MSLDGSVLVIGAGKMGGAILSAWLENEDVSADKVFVEDPLPPAEVADVLAKYDIISSAHVNLTSPPALVLLAVKPQIMDEVLASLANRLDQNSLIFSIAAGKTLDDLGRTLPEGTPIIRAMPNTPVLVQAGMTVMIANDHVSGEQKALIDNLARAMGTCAWLDDEVLMDAVTAISGSGPAYIFHLAECLAKAGEAQGLDIELAMTLAEATIFGAGKLMHCSELTPSILRENVTSKGGTTAAALEVLMDEQEGLSSLIEDAVSAAAKRSKELSG